MKDDAAEPPKLSRVVGFSGIQKEIGLRMKVLPINFRKTSDAYQAFCMIESQMNGIGVGFKEICLDRGEKWILFLTAQRMIR